MEPLFYLTYMGQIIDGPLFADEAAEARKSLYRSVQAGENVYWDADDIEGIEDFQIVPANEVED